MSFSFLREGASAGGVPWALLASVARPSRCPAATTDARAEGSGGVGVLALRLAGRGDEPSFVSGLA